MMFFTSESVTPGHPDKVADQISDSILDEYLKADPAARVAVEVLVAGENIVIAGEVSSTAVVDHVVVARETVRRIGYGPRWGFDPDRLRIRNFVIPQSPEIANGVSRSFEAREDETAAGHDLVGAGDQGLMFGYATDETDLFMPITLQIARFLTDRLFSLSQTGDVLGPDGKSQVTARFIDGVFAGIETLVISVQHGDYSREFLEEYIQENVIEYLQMDLEAPISRVFINPSGSFRKGGPEADAGLTGRKIIVDTYGGVGRHGGGAFSGKDPSKVDRSGAYAARWVAKNLVAAGLCSKAEVQISYAIGVARPVSVFVNSFGTAADDRVLARVVESVFDLRPAAIVEDLKLRENPRYALTAAHGHFGNFAFTWEQLDKVEEIRECFKTFTEV